MIDVGAVVVKKSSLAANDAIRKWFCCERPREHIVDETCITHRMIVSFTILMLAKLRGRMSMYNEQKERRSKKHVIIFISQSRNHFLYSNFILHIEHKTIWTVFSHQFAGRCVCVCFGEMVDVQKK